MTHFLPFTATLSPVLFILTWLFATPVNAQTTPGCTYAVACNYNAEATVDDGSCVFAETHYDCEGNCLLDLNNNGLCDLDETAGCTNADAINYHAEATLDDGSCMVTCKGDFNNDGVITTNDLLSFLAIFSNECEGGGCTDPNGCNYNPGATFNLDFCEYPAEFYDCEGNCLNDSDGDGICDELEVSGCTDPDAPNFNPDATDDDGSCESAQAGFPAGTVFCTDTPTEIIEVLSPATGQIWMDRNLGASQVATSLSDQAAIGDMYQWGRFSDGHQCRNSATLSQLSSTDQPDHGDFIILNGSPADWRSPQNNELWQGVNGINNPCPSGFRLPTMSEFDAERVTWENLNSNGAFFSPLKLPTGGTRAYTTGVISSTSTGNYWMSTLFGTNARSIFFNGSGSTISSAGRGYGFSVRCIKD
jgi:uncharacterized protein (TIGR02145 family)